MTSKADRLGSRARQVVRYLTGTGVAGLAGVRDGYIEGLSGVNVRVSSRAVAWDRDRRDIRALIERGNSSQMVAVIHVKPNATLDESLVTMELRDWAPMFAAWVEANRERLYRKDA